MSISGDSRLFLKDATSYIEPSETHRWTVQVLSAVEEEEADDDAEEVSSAPSTAFTRRAVVGRTPTALL